MPEFNPFIKPTGTITQTKQQFLDKYKDAIDAQGRFIPGKANLNFDGELASDVYDQSIGTREGIDIPDMGIYGKGQWSGFNSEVNADWIEDPRAKGWVGQHPTGALIAGTVLGGVGASMAGLLGTGAAASGSSAFGGGGSFAGANAVGAGDLALTSMPQAYTAAGGFAGGGTVSGAGAGAFGGAGAFAGANAVTAGDLALTPMAQAVGANGALAGGGTIAQGATGAAGLLTKMGLSDSTASSVVAFAKANGLTIAKAALALGALNASQADKVEKDAGSSTGGKDPSLDFIDGLFSSKPSAGTGTPANGGISTGGTPGGGSYSSSMTPGSSGDTGYVDAYGRGVAAAAGEGALSAGRMGIALNDSYLKDYQPYDKKFMGYVDSIGTEGYRANQRGQVMTDIQNKTDAARGTMQRDMAARGINAGDPRYAYLNGQMAIQGAANKAMGAMSSDRSARDEWTKGLGTINAMGQKVGDLGTKNLQVASDLGKTGLQGATLGINAANDTTRSNASMVSAGASSQNAATSAGNLALEGQKFGQGVIKDQRAYDLGLGDLAMRKYVAENNVKMNIRNADSGDQQRDLGTVIGSKAIGSLTDWAVKNYFGDGK